MAVADCVAEGTIPEDEGEDLFISVGVFIHWEASDDAKIQQYNYEATKLSIERAVRGEPTATHRGRAEGQDRTIRSRLVERNQRLHQSRRPAKAPAAPKPPQAAPVRQAPAAPAQPPAPQSTGWWKSLLRSLGLSR